MKPNIPRLRKLVELMMYDEDPERFNMKVIRYDCGTPACLLGHADKAWPGEDLSAYIGIEDDALWAFLFSGYDSDGEPRNHDTPAIAACRVLDVIEAYTP